MLKIGSIDELIRFRQIIAAAKGNVGLFWVDKDFNDILPVETSTVQDIVSSNVSLPDYVSTQKTHASAWKEIPEETRLAMGGNIDNHKSIARGFVAFDIAKDTFVIVGGDWLDDAMAERIANTFGIDGSKYTKYQNADYNAQGNEQ